LTWRLSNPSSPCGGASGVGTSPTSVLSELLWMSPISYFNRTKIDSHLR